MDYIVKSRLVHFYWSGKDPITREDRRFERLASHGQRLHTEDGTGTDTDLYGVDQEEIDRLLAGGHLFSEAELDAMEQGISDDATPLTGMESAARGDTRSSIAVSVRDPDATGTSTLGGGAGHPLTFGEMSQFQIEEYLRTNPPSDLVLDAIDAADTQSEREALANKFLSASNEVEWDGAESLALEVAAMLGVGPAGPGPQDEGVPETAPPESVDDPEGGAEGGGSGEDDESGTDATDGARELAEQEGVDLSQVQGSGSGGRVTKPDVEAYLAEQGK